MIRIATLALIFSLGAHGALAQSVKQGNLSGTLLSASASAPTGGSDALILTAPATGSFVLTQICTSGSPSSGNEDNASVVGSTIGRISQSYGDSTLGTCTHYAQGFAIPAGEELRCVQAGASSGAVTCSVTGVLSKK